MSVDPVGRAWSSIAKKPKEQPGLFSACSSVQRRIEGEKYCWCPYSIKGGSEGRALDVVILVQVFE